MTDRPDIVSRAQAAQIIGITPEGVAGIPDLHPLTEHPYTYLRADVLAIASEYQPVGRTGQRRRVRKKS